MLEVSRSHWKLLSISSESSGFLGSSPARVYQREHLGEGREPWSRTSKQRIQTTVEQGIKEWEGERREKQKWEFRKGETQECFLTTGPSRGILKKLPWSLKIRVSSRGCNGVWSLREGWEGGCGWEAECTVVSLGTDQISWPSVSATLTV